MSASMDDLIGNKLTAPIADMSDDGSGSEVEIEVIDDRPEADRVAPRDASSGENDDFDSEIEHADRKVGNRINRLRYEYHEQRRQKEAAARMQNEAVRYAQGLVTQNNELRNLLERGEKVLLSEIKARTESDLDRARSAYKSAYEEGNSEKMVAAQEALGKSQYEQSVADSYEPAEQTPIQQGPPMGPPPGYQQGPPMGPPPGYQQGPPMRPPMPQRPPPDAKAQAWTQQNGWFGKDEEMTSFALGVHQKLLNQGVDPTSDDYYEKINGRLRDTFPEKFSGGNKSEGFTASPRTTTVVAPANRSSGPPRKVQLTSTQVALAKRLGLSPEQYAKQLLREVSNG